MRSRIKKNVPVILVTNDDGVRAEGITSLAKALRKLGRVVIAAPDGQRSAASHSITLHRPLRIDRLEDDVYSVDGTPTDCVMMAVNEILKFKPDIVVSGINHGPNLGDDVHYSGTVSAAFEGGIIGIPSIAISQVGGKFSYINDAAKFSAKFAAKVLKEGLSRGIILNINYPDIISSKIKGFRFTKQGKRDYGNIVIEKLDPKGRKYYWIGGDETGFEDIEGSDCNAVREGWISITPLRVNLTDADSLEHLKEWKL